MIDVADSLERTARERRTPPAIRLINTKVFDAEYYAAQVRRTFESEIGASEHFVKHGMTHGFSLHPLVDLSMFPEEFQRNYRSGDVEAVLQYLMAPQSREHPWHSLFDPGSSSEIYEGSRVLSKFRPNNDRKVILPGGSESLRWQSIRELMMRRARRSAAAMRPIVNKDALTGDSRGHSSTHTDRLPPAGALDAWARQLDDQEHRKWFVAQAKKTRSVGARDVLAYRATRGRHRYDDLVRVLEAVRIGPPTEILAEFRSYVWRPGLRALARVLFCQRLSEHDQINALTIYEVLIRLAGKSVLEDIDRSYFQDLLISEGRDEEASHVLAEPTTSNARRRVSQRFLHLNSLNPYLSDKGKAEDEWIRGINSIYAARGFTSIDLSEGPEAPFYRLIAFAPEVEAGLPLVTIVMPIYEPDRSTDVAISSLLNQSWSNIELIIVDDHSPRTGLDGNPTDYVSRLRMWEAKDSRIRLILNDENRGAYWARNTGYDAASGEFITVADKDDWHHPQKIEYQARQLMADPDRVANLTNWVRVDQDLRFLLRWGPDRVVHPSFASTMFRRAEIREKLGYWDNVRKSADGEFKHRLQAYYGIDLQPEEPAPLALSLLGTGNLTSEDLGLGFEHEDRQWYWRAYAKWHQEIRMGASAYLPKEPQVRPFVAPSSFLPERSATKKFDVIYLTEFGLENAPGPSLLDEIKGSISSGLRVGVLPPQNFLLQEAAALQMVPEIEDLVMSGRVEGVSMASAIDTDLLVVRWPPVMQVVRDARSGIQAARIVVVADESPYEESTRRPRYDISSVSQTIRGIFGRQPEWAASDHAVLTNLKGLVPAGLLLKTPWEG